MQETQVLTQTVEVSVDINALVEKQNKLERELNRLKEMYEVMRESNDSSLQRVHRRIDNIENELVDVRKAIDELKVSVDLIQISTSNVERHVAEINVKQDVAITAQDKFITQLWKAFFALLGIITVAGTAIVTLVK